MKFKWLIVYVPNVHKRIHLSDVNFNIMMSPMANSLKFRILSARVSVLVYLPARYSRYYLKHFTLVITT